MSKRRKTPLMEEEGELPDENDEQSPEASVKDEKSRRSSGHVPHYAMFAGVFLVGLLLGVFVTPSFTGGVVA
ncbi:MAG: hypothetical protein DRO99_05340, partial [Candidatus Aenigmatarchaeota archaeon]